MGPFMTQPVLNTGINPNQLNQNPYGNLFTNGSFYDANMMGKINNNGQLQQNQFLKCRPVSSKEEARAAQIDLDGSLWVFIDVGNNKIYTKQINNDGTAAFKTYILTADETPFYGGGEEFVTKNEFNKVIQSLIATIQQQNSSNAISQNTTKESSKTSVLPESF